MLRFFRAAAVLIAPVIVSAQAPDGIGNDVIFELKTTRDPAVYRIGERIEIELLFSAKTPGKYKIMTTSAGRIGILDETYSLSPTDGAVDPRANEWMVGFAGSILSSEASLSDKPVSLHADLNEWLRFTRPGTYVVTASSQRILLQDSDDNPVFQKNSHTVHSKPLELTILADQAWSASQLQEISAVLDSDAKPEEKAAAVKRLCYLDTEAAAVEMARRYVASSDSDSWRYELNRALSQASFADAAIPVLEASIENNQQAVRMDVIQLLARLVATQEFRAKFPAPPKQGEQLSREARETLSAYAKRINDLVGAYTKQIYANLATRSGKARASAVYAAWEHEESFFQPDRDRPSPELIRLRDDVLASAPDLTSNQRRVILGFYSQRFAQPSLLQFVRKIATGEVPDSPSVREQAYKTWCGLDEPDCEAALMAEIRKPATDLPFSTLLLPSVKEHPELDNLLTARLKSNPEQGAALIARYGSRALAPAVRRALVSAGWCAIKNNLLAYLLRVAPEEGSAAIAAALQQRSPDNHCYATMIDSIALVVYTPELAKIAEKAVREDSDLTLVDGAARTLSQHGPPSAEDALWDRFANWSDKWRDRADELRQRPGQNYPADLALESNLASAIAQSKQWKISAADLERLANLCVTTSCRKMVEGWQPSGH